MPLFQQSVLTKYLEALPKEQVYAAWGKFSSHFQNPTVRQHISSLKEEEYQEGFVRDLFVHVLGYTLKPQPDYNLVLEQKSTTDTTKSDGAILKDGNVIGVIELKDTRTTDLKGVEKQAFGYKHQHKDCKYVIISNFRELRLYINDAVEYETFDLFYMDKASFDVLYCCLHKEAIDQDVPLKMKQLSIAEEENVTKKLYADYSRFRSLLFEDIVSKNPQFDRLELFQKTQKLLDRFLFILFAEDRSLLTPNSVRIIMQRWQTLKDVDAYKPLYDMFRQYFGYLNTGYSGKDFEVYPYNGGLFAPDETLDAITIDDKLLYDSCMSLSNYNFMSEVDVNILGHIFEHSLTEFEKIQQEIEAGTDGAKPLLEKKETRRKKEGVYYTPRYITKYIVENTVGALCLQKKAELQIVEDEFVPQKKKAAAQALAQKLDQYRDWLLQLTICDPACGSGAFLNQALEYLIQEHHTIDSLKAKLSGTSFFGSDVEKSILENNLFGVDINEEAVEIAKLSLWLRTAKKDRKLSDLSRHIRCGNSLIDDPAVAGDKAFNWEKEFPEVFAKGGFDVVIGNPPYVRADLLGSLKDYLQSNYQTFQPSADLFTFFYEKAFKILKVAGRFAFISNAFDKTNAAIVLRKWLTDSINIVQYVDFTEVQIFEGATTYPVIIVANNQPKKELFDYIKIKKENVSNIDMYQSSQINQKHLSEENWVFNTSSASNLLVKLKVYPAIRERYGKCYYGVKTSLNEAFLVKSGTFNLPEITKPILEGRELSKWANAESTQDLILFKSKWTKSIFGNLEESNAYQKVKDLYPKIIKHLEPFIDKAKGRYDKGDYWWELRNCAYYPLFEQPKIIFPNLQNTNKFSIDTSGVFINAPAVMVSLSHLNNPIHEGKFLLAILNSKLIWYFLKSICVVRSGGYIEVKPQYFEQIPVPDVGLEMKFPFVEKADFVIAKTVELRYIINQMLQLLINKYDHLVLTKKLENWHSLTYKDFYKELEKQKIKLKLSEQSEWMQYFEAEKAKAKAIQDLIDRTDKEIDQMVYELYGLTEEEVRVVEGN